MFLALWDRTRWILLDSFVSFLHSGAQICTQYPRQCSVEQDNPLLCPAAPFLMHPSTVGLPGCQGTLTFNLLSTKNPKSLSADLISSLSSSSLQVHQWLPTSWQLLLNFTLLAITQISHFSRSLCKASLLTTESTALPNLVSSANMLKTPLSPLAESFRKT